MVSDQITDELEEVGDNPEEEIDHFGSTACPNDCVGLDLKNENESARASRKRLDLQKDRQLDL